METDSTTAAATDQIEVRGPHQRRIRIPAPGLNLSVPVPSLPSLPSLPSVPALPKLSMLGMLPGIRQLRYLRPQLSSIELPPPKRLVFYGAMGALALAEVIEWPVTLAVIAAEAVARNTKDESNWAPSSLSVVRDAKGSSEKGEPVAESAGTASRSSGRSSGSRGTRATSAATRSRAKSAASGG